MKRLCLVTILVAVLVPYITSAQIPFWEQVGPFGAYVYCLYGNETGEYAGVDNGGIYHSQDHDQHWRRPQIADEEGSVTCIAGTRNILYAITSMAYPRKTFYRSSDDGRTWVLQKVGNEMSPPVDVAMSGRYIFAATERGVYRSDVNGGA